MRNLPDLLRAAAKSLPPLTDPSFATAFDTFVPNARIILIGDGSHGTSEFYRARAEITKRLIAQHGFNIIAVEADWPDARHVDRFVRRRTHKSFRGDGVSFNRFPTWMWRNTEVDEFVSWLREWNEGREYEMRTGFFGLDLYSMNASIQAVIKYLDHVDSEAAKLARQRYGCLKPWVNHPEQYGLEALRRGHAPCEDAVVKVLVDLLMHRLEYSKMDGEDFMDAEQNANLVADAEHYYRSMYYSNEESWNLRDAHMFDTLKRLMESKGSKAKVVVWAHNSHVGDARYTDMGMTRNELNIGQLCRQQWGKQVSIIGFGTHTGTVAAAEDWDEPMQVMKVLPSRRDSYEFLGHEAKIPRFLLDLRKGHMDENVREELMGPRLERFIGVVYRPKTEYWSHYSKAILPKQFDGFVYIDETSAVTPLPTKMIHQSIAKDETYPFGL